MDVLVYTCGSELESAQKLGWDTTTYIGGTTEDYKNTIVIRWGRSAHAINKSMASCDFPNVINPMGAIALNVQKNLAVERLATVVRVPELFNKAVPKDRLAVVRPVSHKEGNGFRVVKGPRRILCGYYAKEYIPATCEFRVWYCANNRGTILVAKRDLGIPDRHKFINRASYGYLFVNPKKVSMRLHREICKAFTAIGLEVGAADVLWYKGHYYFLELNSSPTLSRGKRYAKIVNFYKENISLLIKEKFGVTV